MPMEVPSGILRFVSALLILAHEARSFHLSGRAALHDAHPVDMSADIPGEVSPKPPLGIEGPSYDGSNGEAGPAVDETTNCSL